MAQKYPVTVTLYLLQWLKFIHDKECHSEATNATVIHTMKYQDKCMIQQYFVRKLIAYSPDIRTAQKIKKKFHKGTDGKAIS
jgi:hypothetical protein